MFAHRKLFSTRGKKRRWCEGAAAEGEKQDFDDSGLMENPLQAASIEE
jgi:hypothetical protein